MATFIWIEQKIKYGVPQRTVLDPLLVLLDINDIDKYVCNLFVNWYADDAVLSVSGTNLEETVDLINSEWETLKNWN